MQEVLVVVPTHNRHAYLKRSSEYLGQFDVNVMFLDSTADAYQGVLTPTQSYFHLPHFGFIQKVLWVFQKTQARYTVLSPDDDFLSVSALRQGLEALKARPERVTATGDFLGFHQKFGHKFYLASPKIQIRDITGDPKQRLSIHMTSYFMLLWSLHKTEVLKLAFEVLNECKPQNHHFIEIAISLAACYLGEIKVVDQYWMAREINLQTSWGRQHPGLNQIESNSSIQQDFERLKRAMDGRTYHGFTQEGFEYYLEFARKKTPRSLIHRATTKAMKKAGFIWPPLAVLRNTEWQSTDFAIAAAILSKNIP